MSLVSSLYPDDRGGYRQNVQRFSIQKVNTSCRLYTTPCIHYKHSQVTVDDNSDELGHVIIDLAQYAGKSGVVSEVLSVQMKDGEAKLSVSVFRRLCALT